MTITPGTKLGRYKIRSQLGSGGMGEVYLAQDTKLDRKVALRILPAEMASNRDRNDCILAESSYSDAHTSKEVCIPRLAVKRFKLWPPRNRRQLTMTHALYTDRILLIGDLKISNIRSLN